MIGKFHTMTLIVYRSDCIDYCEALFFCFAHIFDSDWKQTDNGRRKNTFLFMHKWWADFKGNLRLQIIYFQIVSYLIRRFQIDSTGKRTKEKSFSKNPFWTSDKSRFQLLNLSRKRVKRRHKSSEEDTIATMRAREISFKKFCWKCLNENEMKGACSTSVELNLVKTTNDMKQTVKCTNKQRDGEGSNRVKEKKKIKRRRKIVSFFLVSQYL